MTFGGYVPDFICNKTIRNM